MAFPKTLFRVVAVVIAILLGLVGLSLFGYISRTLVVAASPDGRVEAVCRGRLPESTEYDLWFRAPGDLFGRRVGLVGSESMGRCRAVVWSPGGEVVATLSERGTLSVFDGRTGQAVGFQHLPPGSDGDYVSRRLVTDVRFESPAVVSVSHCVRLWHATHKPGDVGQCGSDVVTERLALMLETPSGAFGR